MSDRISCSKCSKLEPSDSTCRGGTPSVVLVGISEEGKPMTMTVWPRVAQIKEQWCAQFARSSGLVIPK